METAQPAISLLRFSAGDLRLGIAAEDVLLVHKSDQTPTIHIASVLGVEPSGAECRTVQVPRPTRVPEGPEVLAFLADTPLVVQPCDAEQLLPLPRGSSSRSWKPVMGFAKFGTELVLLLDLPSLFSTLMDRYQRGCA